MAKEEITIAGQAFSVPNPYAEGHPLTAGEADALNQTFHENVRNNLAKLAKEGKLTQVDVDEYCSTYEFGVRVGGGTRDPVRGRAMDIARDKVKAALRKNPNINVSDYSAKQISQAAADALEQHPEWLDLARRQIEDEQALAAEAMDDIVAGIGAPHVAQPQA